MGYQLYNDRYNCGGKCVVILVESDPPRFNFFDQQVCIILFAHESKRKNWMFVLHPRVVLILSHHFEEGASAEVISRKGRGFW